MRLIEEAGDLRGAPLAIHALTDPDFFVRKHAYSALEKILETADPDALAEDDYLKGLSEFLELARDAAKNYELKKERGLLA